MECKEVRPLIDAYVDRELSSSEARHVEAHLEQCPECRRESEAVLGVSRIVRQAVYHRAPEPLRSRIVAALPQAAPEAEREARTEPGPAAEPRRPARTRSWLDGWRLPRFAGGGAAAGTRAGAGTAPRFGTLGTVGAMGLALVAAAAIVAVTIALHPRQTASGAFVDELVSSHVRAQLSGRDIDVVSTDQHTVKPWFNGRLDYAPPVEDLASSGFALVGGRLDYVGHRRVAVLIYRYRKHVVDAYVFPDAESGAAAEAEAGAPALVRDGYALVRWREHGMVWWAVTDAAPDVLSRFEDAMHQRLAAGG
jgi:anti-sigma factor (TIGR02949 family)